MSDDAAIELAVELKGESGYRWTVYEYRSKFETYPTPDKPGWTTWEAVGPPEAYVVADSFGNPGREEERFADEGEARKRAAELNAAEVAETLNLDPAFAERRERLRALGETFLVRYGDGHPETRWPEKPGRYALEVYSDRYSESFWETYETLDEVEDVIRREGADDSKVVDLDMGEEVPFGVSVQLVGAAR